MTILSLQDISVGFGGPLVLNQITMQIEPGERVCLVGRNGEGKSTLMSLINGDILPDSGRIIRKQGLRSALVSQTPPAHILGSVFDVVAAGLGELFELIAKHHKITNQLVQKHDPRLMQELAHCEHKLETVDGWKAQLRVSTILSRLHLDPDKPFDDLSGGLKRRVLLAQALVQEPDLLLLDEPTNHLDIESINWLEEFLLSANFSLLFITHDRMLIRKLATRILDLDRGQLTSWPGNYDTYLKRKDEWLQAESSQQSRFDRKLAQEELWIRKGIKARRTRDEGRVQALLKMREEFKNRQALVGKARIALQEAELSGKLVVTAKNISFSFDQQSVVDKLSCTILRGDKIGIIGPNGSGKTTLLRLLFGDLTPDHGTVKRGTNLSVVYFDQLRAQLDDQATVIDNVSEGADTVTINGRQKHIIGYLEDFLFTSDRARSPVYVLSGGERNRLLLAKLFSKPANVLVLDEPTNDLDAETLDLLEELLLEFSGTVVLVSHDRSFLNNVVASTLVFEGKGKIQAYAGGYDDWLLQRMPQSVVESPLKLVKKDRKNNSSGGPRKLSFKENRELEELPQDIEALEAEQKQLYHAMADPRYYQIDSTISIRDKNRLTEIEHLLAISYARWEELENIRSMS